MSDLESSWRQWQQKYRDRLLPRYAEFLLAEELKQERAEDILGWLCSG